MKLLYKNNKNQFIYEVYGFAICQTNGEEGLVDVVYHKRGDDNICSLKLLEFVTKFTYITAIP